MSFNNIVLVGNLGRDPELRYTAQGMAVCQFSMATNDQVKKAGEWEKVTTWFRVTVFGRQAEACSQYLQKGRQVYVQGRLRVEEWEDRDGKKRWTAEVNADRVQFLGSRDDREDREKFDHDARRQKETRDRQVDEDPDRTDEDIPF